jgi:fermentation-respiration switch protein FrsA (DUF1100 family)
MRGTPLGSPAEAEGLGQALCDFLCGRPRIRHDKIGVFGFSLGGYMAVVMASTVERMGPCATLGAPFDFGFLEKASPVVLRRAAFATGFDSVGTIRRTIASLDLSTYLPGMRGPLLVVHGEDDEVVPVRHAELIHHHARCAKELRVIERADHMVSDVLLTEALPLVLDWLGDELGGDGRARGGRRTR